MRLAGFLKLSKFEFMLSLLIVVSVGGPIAYRVYQIHALFPDGQDASTHQRRVVLAMNPGFSIQEYVAVHGSFETATGEQYSGNYDDWSSQYLTRLSLRELTLYVSEDFFSVRAVTDDTLPNYFKENILLFGQRKTLPEKKYRE